MNETDQAVETTLTALRGIAEGRVRSAAWGDVVLRWRWEAGKLKLVVFTEETVLKPREAESKGK